jgi:hypothetical protein
MILTRSMSNISCSIGVLTPRCYTRSRDGYLLTSETLIHCNPCILVVTMDRKFNKQEFLSEALAARQRDQSTKDSNMCIDQMNVWLMGVLVWM